MQNDGLSPEELRTILTISDVTSDDWMYKNELHHYRMDSFHVEHSGGLS